MSERIYARLGLTAAILTMTLAMSVLGYQTVTRGAVHAVEIGKAAPEFSLCDTSGRAVSLAEFRGHAVVLFFGSDACAVSRQYADRLGELAGEYANDGRVKFVAINSNTRAHAASPADLRLVASDRVPTLLDPMANVARAFGASVTPTFCVIDAAGTLRYAGAFDDGDRDGDVRTGRYLAMAVERTADGAPCEITATQAFGRSIVWLK